jgi:hypothetical protein
VFERAQVHHGLHLLVTLLTLGLWSISWIAACIGQWMRPYRCKHCGWHHPRHRVPSDSPWERFRHRRATEVDGNSLGSTPSSPGPLAGGESSRPG